MSPFFSATPGTRLFCLPCPIPGCVKLPTQTVFHFSHFLFKTLPPSKYSYRSVLSLRSSSCQPSFNTPRASYSLEWTTGMALSTVLYYFFAPPVLHSK